MSGTEGNSSEKERVIVPSYKILRMILNQCLRLNMGKAVFSVLLYTILQSVLLGFAMAMMLGAMQGGGIAGTLTGLLALAAAALIIFILHDGLMLTTARMVEKKYVTLGWLFVGFRDKTRRTFRAALIFLALVAVVLGVLSVALARFVPEVTELTAETLEAVLPTLSVLALIVLAVLLLVLLPFSFVWLVLYVGGERTASGAFKKSASLVFGQPLRYIGFLFYAGGRNLIALVVVIVLSSLLPSGDTGVQLLSMLLMFVQVAEQYIVMVRVYMAIPLYFFGMTGRITVHPSDYVPPAQAEQTEAIPDSDAGSGSDGSSEGAE